MTRAITVVVERSPGGGSGFRLSVAGVPEFRFCTEASALVRVRDQLVDLGADEAERGRVLRLLLGEIRRQRRAECVAEVPRG